MKHKAINKLFAITMASTLVVGAFPAAAFAEEEKAPNLEITVTPSEPVVTDNEDGSTTSTVVTEKVTKENGKEILKETEVNSTTTSEASNTVVTDVTRDWSGEKTTPDMPEEDEDDGKFVEGITNTNTVETNGEEHKIDKVDKDYYDRVTEKSGVVSGSETVKETDTTTNKYTEDRPELENDDYIEGKEETIKDDPGSWSDIPSDAPSSNSTPVDPGYPGDVGTTVTPGGTNTGKTEVDENALYNELLAPDRPVNSNTPGTPVNNADGSTTTITTDVKVEDIVDEKGKVVGYTTKTTVTNATVTVNPNTESVPSDPVTTDSEPVTTDSEPIVEVKLPEKPEESQSTDEETGLTTIITVTDIVDESGKVVGFQKNIKVTDEDENEVGSFTESVWGTLTTTVTSTETIRTTETVTTHTTTTTTTTLITEGTTTSGVKIVATDREITASMGEVNTGENHGTNILQGLPVDVQTIINNGNSELIDPSDTVPDKTIGDGLFHYLGHAAESNYLIYRMKNGSGGSIDNYIYLLKDKAGNKFYAYCADMATSAVKGTLYEIGNIEDESYYQNNAQGQAEAHIRAIALNGYWGTTSGTGSLENIKKMLKDDYGWSDERLATLTDGQALTATQAAIWKFGNNDSGRYVVETDVTQRNWTTGVNSEQADKNIQDLFEILVGLTEPRDSSTNILDPSDIVSASIVAGNKADHENNLDDNDKNDVYNTSVSFTLAVIPDDTNDNLTLRVLDPDGNELASKRLTSSGEGVTNNADGTNTYTINNIELQEGININLSLDGTQHLKKGVYLYTAKLGINESQTFVGVAEGSHVVDLDVNMTFKVEEATAAIEENTSHSGRTKTSEKVTKKVDTEIDQEVIALMEVTTVKITETKRVWNGEYFVEYSYDDESDPPEEKKKEEKKKEEKKKKDFNFGDSNLPLEEFEEDLPLDDFNADPVKTSDASVLYIALSGLSGLGLTGIAFAGKRKEEDDEE